MAIHEVLLTDEQWQRIEPLIPPRPRSARGGRPPADDRCCFEGILWVLKTGARWKDLPEQFPSPSTCWRRMSEWAESGVLEDIWIAFLDQLDDQQVLDGDELFVDGTFSPAKKGGWELEPRSGGREPSGWLWLMVLVFLSHVGP